MQEIKNASSHPYTSTAVLLPSLLLFLLLLVVSLSKTIAIESPIALPKCPDSCGGVPIPYPFGIGPNCFRSGFEVTCNATNNGTSVPYLGETIVLNVSLSLGQTRVNMPVANQCYNSTTKSVDYFNWGNDLTGSPYRFNPEKNKFVVIGCGALGYLNFTNNHNYNYLGGCISGCDSSESLADGSCSGIGCCQTSIPEGTYSIEFSFDQNFSDFKAGPCNYAMLTDEDGFSFNTKYITTDMLSGQYKPAVFDWAIANTTCATAQTNSSSFACISENSVCVDSSSGLGYICNCSKGYQGNPYLRLQGGCKDIDECANYNPCSNGGKCRNLPGSYKCSCLFGWRNGQNNLRECERNSTVIIGTTCAGIVALCFLGLGTCVVHERWKFSQVKEKYFLDHGGRILLEKIQSDQGCGFIIFTKKEVEHATNNFDGTNIIGHGGQGTVYKGTLKDQMVAIKKSKVSDFGASILAPTNEAQFVTLVQGTCGYLDPEYIQSCHLTDKSDVYSFGVVLLELLTRKPAIDFDALEEERSLSSCFLLAIKENKMDELLDNQIKCEDDMEVIINVVELVKECLNIKGEERPTMKEVAQELNRIKKLKEHSWGQDYDHEEMETLLGEASHEIVIGHTGYFNIDKEAAESIAIGR
ncbi:Wall-associated receptor kinase 2 [Rhynchospora pubera]|uniref:Wall-associated receptor kinase 2 n=1 Tax=Rhynchospora pubera TaxID=906938 RepID=A0AAV8BQZ3_9POAL|nr:Wall-associated receptor kinase 2 [Rhynchospora pubera]